MTLPSGHGLDGLAAFCLLSMESGAQSDNSGASTARFDIFYNKSEIKFSPIERIVKLTLTIFANSKATGHTEIEQAVALDNI